MNYREKMRKAIECPQFGNERYGEWGALRFEQRVLIKRLLDELDSADNCVKRLYLKNRKQKEVIDKAIETLEKGITFCENDSQGLYDKCNIAINREQKILDILNEVE